MVFTLIRYQMRDDDNIYLGRIEAQLLGQPAGPWIAKGKALVIRQHSNLADFKYGAVLACDAVDPNITFHTISTRQLLPKLRFSSFQKSRNAFPGGIGAGNLAKAPVTRFQSFSQIPGGDAFLNGLRGYGYGFFA